MSNHLIGIRKMHGFLHPPLHTADKQDDFTIFDKIVDLFAIFTFNHYRITHLFMCASLEWRYEMKIIDDI